jgi:hypothetical protein
MVGEDSSIIGKALKNISSMGRASVSLYDLFYWFSINNCSYTVNLL